jgi:hypothetical protein
MELAYERGFVSTFVIVSGDSDFTPLVAALRSLNRRVVGIGTKGSTSALLPPACDEFMFYDRLPGVPEVVRAPRANGKKAAKAKADDGTKTGRAAAQAAGGDGGRKERERGPSTTERDQQELWRTVTQTLAGLKQRGSEPVYASTLKRALLRKDPTFSEGDYGFRAFGEMLAQMERHGLVSLTEGQAPGDPAVDFPDPGKSEDTFELLRRTVQDLQGAEDEVPLSGLKDQIRKREPEFSEKTFGYSGFGQYAKAAAAAGAVVMEWDEDEGDYFLWVPD